MNTQNVTEEVLDDYSSSLSSHLERGEDFTVYYSNGGDTITILTVVDRDDDKELLNYIYASEAKILKQYLLGKEKKYEDLKLSFRVVPKYNNPVSAIIPSTFRRYAKT